MAACLVKGFEVFVVAVDLVWGSEFPLVLLALDVFLVVPIGDSLLFFLLGWGH